MDLYVYSDFGRVLNPMLIVHNKDNQMSTNLTETNVERILSGKCDI